MARRKRKHIPIIEIAASALQDKLPPIVRIELRSREATAREVLRMFTPDHLRLHCWGGRNVDRWWNLDMRLRGPELKAKDAADTSRAAKTKRIRADWAPMKRAIAAGKKPPRRKRTWPKRKMRRGA